MNFQATPDASVFESYEVKVFNKISSELILLEKVLDLLNKKDNDKNENKGILLDKISTIWTTLNNLISKEKKEAEQNLPQNELKNFNEVLFIIVSMIDEFFIRKEKQISDFWSKNLFELSYFNSRSAGSEFYDKIDDVLSLQNEKKKSVLYVYFLALCMGFKGKNFGVDKEKEILYYKRTLYTLVFNKSSYSLDGSNSYYLSNSLNSDSKQKFNHVHLTNNKAIYYFSIIFISLYLIVSYLMFLIKKYISRVLLSNSIQHWDLNGK